MALDVTNDSNSIVKRYTTYGKIYPYRCVAFRDGSNTEIVQATSTSRKDRVIGIALPISGIDGKDIYETGHHVDVMLEGICYAETDGSAIASKNAELTVGTGGRVRNNHVVTDSETRLGVILETTTATARLIKIYLKPSIARGYTA